MRDWPRIAVSGGGSCQLGRQCFCFVFLPSRGLHPVGRPFEDLLYGVLPEVGRQVVRKLFLGGGEGCGS